MLPISRDLADTIVATSVYALLFIAAVTVAAFAYIAYHIEEHTLPLAQTFLHSSRNATQLAVAGVAFALDTIVTGIILLNGVGTGGNPKIDAHFQPYSVTFFIYLAIYFTVQIAALFVAIPAIVRVYRVMRREDAEDADHIKAVALLRRTPKAS